jgi:hypothetical protein
MNKGTKFTENVHTLAQLRHCQSFQGLQPVKTEVKNNLKKRARSKYFTNHLVYKLVDEKSTLSKSYWNTWHCTNIIQQEGQKLTAKYCNNRWCQVCNRIRTAKAIKGYLPQIMELDQPQFVTLSRPNVKAADLKTELKTLLSQFKKVQNHFRRTEGKILQGLRKLECTYNWKTKEYHPHLHIIVEGGENTGEKVVSEWLKFNPTAHEKGQDYRPIADDKSALEMFKYFTKLTTKVDISGESVSFIHSESLNVIFEAMRGRRVYQPIGTLKKVTEDVEELQSEEYEDIENVEHDIWTYFDEFGDWVNSDGELLTGYTPSESMKELTGAKQYQGKYNELILANFKRFEHVRKKEPHPEIIE